MMHFRNHGRVSLIAWSLLLVALAVCYLTIVAGLAGVVSAWNVSLVTFSSAMAGCVAALVYLVAAMRDVRTARRAR
jgi:nicotinamide riboside transporter PnuC